MKLVDELRFLSNKKDNEKFKVVKEKLKKIALEGHKATTMDSDFFDNVCVELLRNEGLEVS